MSTKQALHDLIDRLDEERTGEALRLLSDLVENDGPEGSGAGATDRTSPPLMSGRAFRLQPPMDWRTLAAQQGVKPITDPDQLIGDFWPEDESIDDFLAAVREWRREGGYG